MSRPDIADVLRWIDIHRYHQHDAQLVNIGIGGYSAHCRTCNMYGPTVIFDLAQLERNEGLYK